MAGLGSLVVELSANIAKFEAGMSRASYLADQNMKQVQKSVDSLKGTLQGLAGVVAGAFAFEGLSNFIDQVIEAGSANEKFTASMQAMGRIYGISKESLDLVSGSIEKLGIDGHEAAVSMSNFLKYGIEITKLPRLAEMAKDLSAIDTEGRNAREMFMQLVNAIGRGPRALMQLRLGSGEEFKAMSKDIKEMEDEAFLSMPERANLAFKLLEKATKGFEGVSSSVLDTYKKKQADAALAAQQFKEALFDLAKPVLSAVIQEQINSWAAFTAALANNRQALAQTGETLALFVGRIANAVGNVVTFVNAHKQWAEAILGLYGMTRLITLVGGLASTLATAVIAVGRFVAGLITLKGLVSSPWPPVVITVTAVGIAAVLTGLKQIIQAKLEASGVINPNVAGRPVTAGPRDQVISSEGTKSSARERAEIISQYEAQANAAKDLAEKERIANEQAAEAARRRQEEVKTTMPLDKGGKGGGAEAAANALQSFIQTMEQETAKAAGDTEASLSAWYSKQALTLDKLAAKNLDVTQGKEALDAAYYSKLEKLNSDFTDWYNSELGNQYNQLVAQERKKLAEVAGNADKIAKVQEVYDRKHYDLAQQTESERLNIAKSYTDEIANASPFLTEQLAIKQKLLPLENEIARLELERRLNSLNIAENQKDELRGLQALAAQAKKYALEREKWETEGIGGGLKIWAKERGQEGEKSWANQTKQAMRSLESGISSTISKGLLGALKGEKVELEQFGWDIADAFISKTVELGVSQLFTMIAQAVLPMTIAGTTTGIELTMAGMEAAMELEMGAAMAGAELIAAATEAAAIMAASSSLSFGIFHSGGVIRAHGGLNLAHDEVPIIAQTGERVLSRSQNKAFEAGLNMGGGSGPVTINYSPNFDRRPTGYERRRDIREMNKALASEMGRRN